MRRSTPAACRVEVMSDTAAASKEKLLVTVASAESTVASSASTHLSPAETEQPLPWKALLVVCMMNANEGFQVNVIWPFLPLMVEDFDVRRFAACCVVAVLSCAL